MSFRPFAGISRSPRRGFRRFAGIVCSPNHAVDAGFVIVLLILLIALARAETETAVPTFDSERYCNRAKTDNCAPTEKLARGFVNNLWSRTQPLKRQQCVGNAGESYFTLVGCLAGRTGMGFILMDGGRL
jgi:hypothetical protein